MYNTFSFYPFTHLPIAGQIGCLHILAIVNNAILNRGLHMSFRVSVLFSLNTYPEVELVVLLLIFWGISILFPSTVHKGSLSSHALEHLFLVFCLCFDTRCEVIANILRGKVIRHCDFDLQHSLGWEYSHSKLPHQGQRLFQLMFSL